MAFLPNGDMLVTERPGRLRIVSKAGKLDPEPIAGLPPIFAQSIAGLMDVELHPEFREEPADLPHLFEAQPATTRRAPRWRCCAAKWNGGRTSWPR